MLKSILTMDNTQLEKVVELANDVAIRINTTKAVLVLLARVAPHPYVNTLLRIWGINHIDEDDLWGGKPANITVNLED